MRRRQRGERVKQQVVPFLRRMATDVQEIGKSGQFGGQFGVLSRLPLERGADKGTVNTLDALRRNIHLAQIVGDPGAAATSNAAGNTTRMQATFGSSAASGLISNTVAILWTNVSTSEDYTHFSAWTASTAGTFGFSGTVTANAVTAGDDFEVAVGGLDVSLTVAS